MSRFAHEIKLTKTRGRWMVACTCGWPGVGKVDSEDEAVAAYKDHAGIKEKEVRK